MYYKLGQMLLQSEAAFLCCKARLIFLQNGGGIMKWDNYYKVWQYNNLYLLQRVYSKADFKNYLRDNSKLNENISDLMYVTDLTSGCSTIKEVKSIKHNFEAVFKRSSFYLRRWHSKIPSLGSRKIPILNNLT